MTVQSSTVSAWHGLDVRARHSLGSDRRPLDTPRELVNMQVDANGHLHMPRAPGGPVETFGDDIYTIRTGVTPRCILVQLRDGRIYGARTPEAGRTLGAVTFELLTTLADDAYPVWTLSAQSSILMGYSARGGSSGGEVFEITPDGPDGFSVADVSSSFVFDGVSFATPFKGRLFTVYQGRTVRYSELNDFTNFPEDNRFQVGGDDQGNSYTTYPGAVQGMVAWEDVLLIFLANSVWILSGSGPETWQLRQATTTSGNSQPFALTRVNNGVLSVGGTSIEDVGAYLFTGSQAQKVSDAIEPLLREFDSPTMFGEVANGCWYLAHPSADPDARQVFVYDLGSGEWTTFDGFVYGQVAASQYGLLLANGKDLLRVSAGDVLPRAPGRSAKVTLGWDDEANPTGFQRFLAVKLSGRKAGVGTPTLQLTAREPSGGEVTSAPVSLTTDVFDGVVLPVNVRGHAVEIELMVTPADDTNSVTIESLQLVHSRKGEKVSRA